MMIVDSRQTAPNDEMQKSDLTAHIRENKVGLIGLATCAAPRTNCQSHLVYTRS